MSTEEKRRVCVAFEHADFDGDGFINTSELCELMTSLGNNSDFDVLLEGIDANSDGRISMQEFINSIFDSSFLPSGVAASLDQLMRFRASGDFVKSEFSVEDLASYNERCLADDDSWRKLQDSLRKSGTVFEDERFGANDESLYGGGHGSDLGDSAAEGERPNYKVKSWRRIWDLAAEEDRNGPLFKADARASDVRQGSLGDCYFVSAVSAVAESPFMARLVPGEQSINPEGIYAVRFWRDGAWRVVVVDDRIPCRSNGKPIFAKAVNGKFWVSVVEKAFAKLNGSYRAIKGGEQPQALNALTGLLLPKSVKLRPYRKDADDKEELFGLMQSCLRQGGLLGCGSKGKWENGIAPLHAYTILGLYEVPMGGSVERLVHVRNPWGSGREWKGDFSDGDSAWERLLEEDRGHLKGDRVRHDGTWFMSFDDFCQNFYIAYFGTLPSAETRSLYRVASEVCRSMNPRIYVKPISDGIVRLHCTGQDKRGLPEGVTRSLCTFQIERAGKSTISFVARDLSSHSFKVTAGEELIAKVRGGDARVYALIDCPNDAEVSVDHGDGSGLLVVEDPVDAAAEHAALRVLVATVGETRGWNSEDEDAVLEKLVASGIMSPQDLAEAVLAGDFNDRFPRGKKFSKRTLRHFCGMAEALKELIDCIAEVAGSRDWDSDDQTKIIDKLVLVGVTSSESLVNIMLEGNLNARLRDAGFSTFGKKSLQALSAWAREHSDKVEDSTDSE